MIRRASSSFLSTKYVEYCASDFERGTESKEVEDEEQLVAC